MRMIFGIVLIVVNYVIAYRSAMNAKDAWQEGMHFWSYISALLAVLFATLGGAILFLINAP